MNIWSTASLIKELVYTKWNKVCESVSKSINANIWNVPVFCQRMPPLPVFHNVIPYLLSKMIAGIKYHPAANSSQGCGEYVRWYCTERLQRRVKTNMPVLTPLGYSPGFISGMLISQSDLCFCSFVLTAFRNHVVLMQPLKEKCSYFESAVSVGMNKRSHLLNF